MALVSFLYMLWRLARQLPLLHEDGAEDRGRWIYHFQKAVHLPSELHMEQWVSQHQWLAKLTVDYYATVHVPALLAFLVWLWVRHREPVPALAQRPRDHDGLLPLHPVHPRRRRRG